MLIGLYDEAASQTVSNFLAYVENKFYDQTIFHRTIDGSFIQGGGYTYQASSEATLPPQLQKKEEGLLNAIDLEKGLSNVCGTLSMARLASPNTAQSQFFINTTDNTYLDYQNDTSPGYAVFGQVIEGMLVADTISQVVTEVMPATLNNNTTITLRDIPKEVIEIESIRPPIWPLNFEPIQTSYKTGEILKISLNESLGAFPRQEVLDLWVAVQTPNEFIYITPSGFSTIPTAFIRSVPKDQTNHSILNFIVPEGLTGQFTLYAIFNSLNEGIQNIDKNRRSNIAEASLKLVQ